MFDADTLKTREIDDLKAQLSEATADYIQRTQPLYARLKELEPPPPLKRPREPRMSKARRAAIQAACEELAARYPVDDLPAGDAGLIEAERRIAEFSPQLNALYDALNLAIGKEEDLFGDLPDTALFDLENFIGDAEPEGFAGALVKLRLLANDDTQDDEIRARFRQILVFVERQAARAAQ
jgi:hypothetical protein